MAKVIAMANQKGGVLKTSVSVNLSAGLAKRGYKVLAADLDPQGDLTTSLGFRVNDELPNTMATFMEQTMKGERA